MLVHIWPDMPVACRELVQTKSLSFVIQIMRAPILLLTPFISEENAQVVPFLGFSTSTESSNFNDGENMLSSPPSVPGQVLHEMQALQCDMDMLQDEIDLL